MLALPHKAVMMMTMMTKIRTTRVQANLTIEDREDTNAIVLVMVMVEVMMMVMVIFVIMMITIMLMMKMRMKHTS